MKKLARFLAEMVVHHLVPVVVFTIVFFMVPPVMMTNTGAGLGQALTYIIYHITVPLVWILFWNAIRVLFKTDSEPADLPADSPVEPPLLDSAARLKLSAEAEEGAKGAPIKDVVADNPGSSAGVWMAWFWVLAALCWLSFLRWLVSH